MTDTSPDNRRARLAVWLETMPVRKFIIGVILFNAVLLGLETSKSLPAKYKTLIRLKAKADEEAW